MWGCVGVFWFFVVWSMCSDVCMCLCLCGACAVVSIVTSDGGVFLECVCVCRSWRAG